MNDMLPYHNTLQILFKVFDALLIATVLLFVLIERQIRLAHPRVGNPNSERSFRYFPAIFSLHRKMFPQSWLRRACISAALLLLATLFVTQDLVRRDQYAFDMAVASSRSQSAKQLTMKH
jgi:hypothetical protein